MESPPGENGREHVNGCVVFCGVTIPWRIHYPFNRYLLCFPFLPLWTILHKFFLYILQFSSVAQSCPTLCDPMDCSTPGLPVHHQLLEFTQTHVHQVSDPIQPIWSSVVPFSSSFNLSQRQGLFQWVSSSHQVAEVLEPQHQKFQWIFIVDFL